MSERMRRSDAAQEAKTLLLVDDEMQVSAALKRVLYREGYRILTANGADEAMALLARERVDVIVSDHRMPRRSGTDFLREVQKRYPDTVRLILSGAADVADIAAAMESGAIYKFLTKPIDPLLLRANVREAFSRAEAVRRLGSRGSEAGAVPGLPSRQDLGRVFTELASRAERSGETVCLLMVQVDQYQNVLSSFGHLFAQAFLAATARALQGRLSRASVLGHDTAAGTFLVLTAAHDPLECIRRIDDDMERLFRSPVEIHGRQISVTVSVGATVAGPAADFEALVDQARTAMMTGSDRGGATVQLFQPHLIGAFRKKLELESDLRRAVAQKAFLVHYQPQVEVAAHKIVGLEALVRWPHPERGLVSPAEFIPVAERLGLIEEIGDWVIETAVTQLAAWTKAGIAPGELAINVSPLQLKERSVVDSVSALLRRTHLPARRLVLEITESAAIAQESAIADCLERLHDLGVRLAVDDFGTGYANLSNLTRLPFQKLKIDRSLLPKKDDERSARLFANVVALAKELALAPIAEGVETADELRAIRGAGCGIVQGYYYGAPADAERLARLLSQARMRGQRHR